MSGPTVKTIMHSWLLHNGYDGLIQDDAECGCHFRKKPGERESFMDCEMVGIELCRPAYKREPTEGESNEGHEWMMTTIRPEVTNMSNPTTKDILLEWLEQHGYDGLCNPEIECGCYCCNELIPCGELGIDCQAGYKHVGTDGDSVITLEKDPNHAIKD